jgi:crotonobetainyl-CoA:carnitine CoA-transferase CaiB-like acyl-CoA transferase
VLNSYPDYIFPPFGVATLLAALLYRRRTGKGVYLDGAQVEAGARMQGAAILDYVVNGRIAERLGSRDPYMAPHAVYPCRGDDRWLAIAVSNEEEWQAFVKAMGAPDWCQERKFSSVISRKENEDELDSLIAHWTSGYTPEQAMQLLQDAGVPAAIVATGEDLAKDPQLRYREHYVLLDHRAIGRHAYHAPAYRLSKTWHRMWKAAPCLGEDNLYVYKEILGFSEAQISDLMAESVITTEADLKPMISYR